MDNSTDQKTERVGIFGGTFDPIHDAHLDIARAALEQAALDCVYFVVAARPPHKDSEDQEPPEDRYGLVEAAVAGEPRMKASRAELDRDGPSYMVDTLKGFQATLPNAALELIIGMDSLVDLPSWRDPAGILERAHLLVVPRPGSWDIPPSLAGHYTILGFDQTSLSSTEVRRRIQAGESLDGLAPPAVIKLINQKGLYRSRV